MNNNRVAEASNLIAEIDAVAKQRGMRLVAVALAVLNDDGDFTVAMFNPHMSDCKCQDCKELVAEVKAVFNACDAYGQPPKTVTQ